MRALFLDARGIPDDCSAGRHVLRHDRAHAYNGSGTDGDPLADDSGRADIGTVANGDIPVAVHTRGEGYKIANHAVVRDVAVNVGVEMKPDFGPAGNHRAGAENCALADFDIVPSDDIECSERGSRFGQSLRNRLSRRGIANSDQNVIFGSDFGPRYHPTLSDIGGKNDVAIEGRKGFGSGGENLMAEAACSKDHKPFHGPQVPDLLSMCKTHPEFGGKA